MSDELVQPFDGNGNVIQGAVKKLVPLQIDVSTALTDAVVSFPAGASAFTIKKSDIEIQLNVNGWGYIPFNKSEGVDNIVDLIDSMTITTTATSANKVLIVFTI